MARADEGPPYGRGPLAANPTLAASPHNGDTPSDVSTLTFYWPALLAYLDGEREVAVEAKRYAARLMADTGKLSQREIAAQPVTQVRTQKVCPTCGTVYGPEAQFCQKDATPLKASQ